jgi:predicted ATP-grasp superfamily ATP-dependent carboligase
MASSLCNGIYMYEIGWAEAYVYYSKYGMKKTFIVFSGYNQRAVIAFLRTLESDKCQYAVIATSPADTIFLTKYGSKVSAVRKSSALELTEILRNIRIVQRRIKSDRYVIAPSTEALNRFLLQNRKELEGHNCEIPLVDKELYEKISDKYEFNSICSQHGILVPREYVTITKAKIPYVAKPKKYFSRTEDVYNPILIFSKEAHKSFMKENDIGDFYYQEFVGGKSFYLLYYFCSDGTTYKFSQENYLQQPQGKSIIAAVSSNFHHTRESLKYEKLLEALNFVGFVMVEVKRYKDRNYMIEANPRFWGPSQLFVDAGVNLFKAFLYDLKLIHKKPNLKREAIGIKYFWFGGLMQSLLNEGNVTYHNYSSTQFVNDLPGWFMADIYNRRDTSELFKMLRF